jgi:hypothetical protein
MPHESTVEPERYELPAVEMLKLDIRSRRTVSDNGSIAGGSLRRASVMAETPKTITHHHDDDSFDSTHVVVSPDGDELPAGRAQAVMQ